MRTGINDWKNLKTAFGDQIDEYERSFDDFDPYESYEDKTEPVIQFLSLLMLLNDIFVRFQEI